ncbi:heme lyase NrfEFG subunit NrfE [Pasteurella multocida]|uniref:heme lyase NrfEFG subunit NrfE n=1 Tax=Pasteurella multocida TaxID=747 RepID=UPI002023E212|nr:heme lyase NrfEFG subunit NrfE [Pasteurella multocida]URK01875.1 heme lyase NrfEFG subunit NrfE [Pasteurella multocida]WND45291.1 heme lyase NrfEFG subunit NrfE [Pasteurella multocida]WRK10604.1 heme lyase NrfEFG subunit NrfE [Pasteurella multocida]HDR1859149.1 heme lyase NrfEFG subunit NrfE [Pasteurella multocida]HDR1893584.1 heme lyase NrfEFG subunit NrfE [Pasteurella multocida]
MIPELGFLALLIASLCAFLLALVPQVGIFWRKPYMIGTAWNLSYLFGIFTCIALFCLAYAFALDDFSVQYVAQHSNSQLPIFFKVSATWGGHEGSMLFWLFALALWLMLFAFSSRHKDPIISARALSVLGLICFGFCLFILFLSNPFERSFPQAFEGRDLNPMLQDVGLIFHPPLLYLGYVGFAVNFAITISALVSGHLDAAVARMMRPWVLLSWLFLTLGIVLGSWWAYYELGWGGWWFWDPVENASLMPWLLGLALLHSLSITEQRGIFSYWTILFSLLAFSFSLLGTFIVRSGVLTSVHAFAVDGERGIALLILFFLLTVSAFTLFALKVNLPQSAVRFRLISKENALLLLNILLTIATVSVFLGTFYPIVFTALQWGSISVGAPYFNTIFLPLFVMAMLAMILVLSLRWKTLNKKTFIQRTLLLFPALILAYGLIRYYVDHNQGLPFNFTAYGLLSLSIWLILATLWLPWTQLKLKQLAMVIAHLGVAITAIGAIMSSYYSSEIGVRLAPQQRQKLGDYEFYYQGFQHVLGPNYTSEKTHFVVTKQNQAYAEIYPERRYYDVRTMNMSEVGIDWGWLGDVYIVMGDKLGQGEFTFRLQYKPFIRWLWFGGLLMALGALLAIFSLRNSNEAKPHRQSD